MRKLDHPIEGDTSKAIGPRVKRHYALMSFLEKLITNPEKALASVVNTVGFILYEVQPPKANCKRVTTNDYE